jgi:hypothetical protein
MPVAPAEFTVLSLSPGGSGILSCPSGCWMGQDKPLGIALCNELCPLLLPASSADGSVQTLSQQSVTPPHGELGH